MIKEIKNALQYAKEAHGEQLRSVGPDTGLPYFDTHIIRVTNAVPPWAKAAAALHDVVEDTDKNIYDLVTTGWFSPETLIAVDMLTQRKQESYRDYIHRMAVCDQWDIDNLLYHYAKDRCVEATKGDLLSSAEEDFNGIMSDGRSIAYTVKIADIMDNITTLPEGPMRGLYLGALHTLTEEHKLDSALPLRD